MDVERFRGCSLQPGANDTNEILGGRLAGLGVQGRRSLLQTRPSSVSQHPEARQAASQTRLPLRTQKGFSQAACALCHLLQGTESGQSTCQEPQPWEQRPMRTRDSGGRDDCALYESVIGRCLSTEITRKGPS